MSSRERLPTRANILGIPYSISYLDNPTNVDRDKRRALWGQIDHWTRTIRVYADQRPIEDIWQTILHETLHAIASALNIKSLDDNEDDLDILALALADVLTRNRWWNIDEQT